MKGALYLKTLVNFDEISRHFDASYLFDGKMPIFFKKRREKCDKFICNALSLFFKPPPQSLKKIPDRRGKKYFAFRFSEAFC